MVGKNKVARQNSMTKKIKAEDNLKSVSKTCLIFFLFSQKSDLFCIYF